MASFITAGNATNGLQVSSDNTGILELKSGTGSGTTAVTIGATQNVGIGTSSPTTKLDVSGILTTRSAGGGEGGQIDIANPDNTTTGLVVDVSSQDIARIFSTRNNSLLQIGQLAGTGGVVAFATAATERARITSGGYSKFSNDGTYIGATATYHELRNSAAEYIVYCTNTNAGPAGIVSQYTAVSPNGTGNLFLNCTDSTALRASIRSNGGIANFSANNVNLSDRREKTNFAPAKNYLDVICAIPVQTFNYIDQNIEEDPGETLGVVAQDVQAVAPEMVMESNWGTKEEPKMRLSIYQTDLQYALMKSIQELKAIVDAQAAEIAALKGA